jgi:hypothetical protein
LEAKFVEPKRGGGEERLQEISEDEAVLFDVFDFDLTLAAGRWSGAAIFSRQCANGCAALISDMKIVFVLGGMEAARDKRRFARVFSGLVVGAGAAQGGGAFAAEVCADEAVLLCETAAWLWLWLWLTRQGTSSTFERTSRSYL